MHKFNNIKELRVQLQGKDIFLKTARTHVPHGWV